MGQTEVTEQYKQEKENEQLKEKLSEVWISTAAKSLLSESRMLQLFHHDCCYILLFIDYLAKSKPTILIPDQ